MMNNRTRNVDRRKCEISASSKRRDEARNQIRHALLQWQQACDAWLSAKSEACNRTDHTTRHSAKVLKCHISQASVELKQALQLASAI